MAEFFGLNKFSFTKACKCYINYSLKLSLTIILFCSLAQTYFGSTFGLIFTFPMCGFIIARSGISILKGQCHKIYYYCFRQYIDSTTYLLRLLAYLTVGEISNFPGDSVPVYITLLRKCI